MEEYDKALKRDENRKEVLIRWRTWIKEGGHSLDHPDRHSRADIASPLNNI
jgi:hypothetical protein